MGQARVDGDLDEGHFAFRIRRSRGQVLEARRHTESV
jgi:hypothetical protein